MRTVTALMTGLAAVLLCGTGFARPEPILQHKKILVLPVAMAVHDCDLLFTTQAPQRSPSTRIHRVLEERLEAFPTLKVLSFRDARRKISERKVYQENLGTGRERYLLAREQYRELRHPEAESNLLHAIRILGEIFYELVEPEAFAEIYFLLGVTQIEMGRPEEAHQAFKRALALDPFLHVPSGYYPARVEQALSVACTDLRSGTAPPTGSDIHRGKALAETLALDALLVVRWGGTPDRPRLALVVLDRRTGSLSFEEEISLTGVPDRDDQELDRLASRWVACTPFHVTQPSIETEHRFLFSAAYQQMAYLTYPTRSMLHSMGFSFETGLYLLNTFGFVGKVQFTSSLPDRFDDMLEPLRSVRLMAGPSFSLAGAWWRLYLVPSLEVQFLSSFRTSTVPDCKFYIGDSPRYEAMCNSGQVKHYPTEIQGGVNLSLGSQFFFSNRLFVGVSLSISTYFLPLDRSIEMNFPVSLEGGGGIAF
jgi:tetratricopeptide (TPR) repeat protein